MKKKAATETDKIEGCHYQAGIETWDWLVQLCHSLREANVSDEELLACIFAQKYLSTRLGHKRGETLHNDMFKICNYMHKGTFGTWIKDQPIPKETKNVRSRNRVTKRAKPPTAGIPGWHSGSAKAR